MTRYTTPALDLLVEGVDISADDIYVSFVQELPCGQINIEKKNADLIVTTETHGQDTDTKIIVLFTQEESAKFAPGKAVFVKPYIQTVHQRLNQKKALFLLSLLALTL